MPTPYMDPPILTAPSPDSPSPSERYLRRLRHTARHKRPQGVLGWGGDHTRRGRRLLESRNLPSTPTPHTLGREARQHNNNLLRGIFLVQAYHHVRALQSGGLQPGGPRPEGRCAFGAPSCLQHEGVSTLGGGGLVIGQRSQRRSGQQQNKVMAEAGAGGRGRNR